MNKSPSLKLVTAGSEASIREALDAVDRSEVKKRVLIALFIGGVIAEAIWLGAALRKSAAPHNAIIIRAVALIVSIQTVAAVKVGNEINKNTRTILQAILGSDSKSKRIS
jgi:hypothetical protein